MATRLTWETAIDVLLERVPELLPVYQRLLDQEGPPIDQYNLIARAAEWAQALATGASTDPGADAVLRRLGALLEEMAASDDPFLPDLMGAGFVEALDPDAPGYAYTVGLLGPASRAQVESWYGPLGSA